MGIYTKSILWYSVSLREVQILGAAFLKHMQIQDVFDVNVKRKTGRRGILKKKINCTFNFSFTIRGYSVFMEHPPYL